MSKLLKILLLGVLLSNVMGCSHLYGDHGVIKNRESDYLKAQAIQPIQVPSGYSKSTIQNNYPVPEKQYPATRARIDLTPPGLAAQPATPAH